jgi:hypothetical protein
VRGELSCAGGAAGECALRAFPCRQPPSAAHCLACPPAFCPVLAILSDLIHIRIFCAFVLRSLSLLVCMFVLCTCTPNALADEHTS